MYLLELLSYTGAMDAKAALNLKTCAMSETNNLIFFLIQKLVFSILQSHGLMWTSILKDMDFTFEIGGENRVSSCIFWVKTQAAALFQSSKLA